MHSNFLRAALLASAAFAASAPALSQSPDAAARRSPLDAKAEVPPLVYRSPFTAYQSIMSEKPRSWREVNDNVERIGGWRVYLKEAQQPEAPPANASPAEAPPANAPPADAPAQADAPAPRGKGEAAQPTPSERRGHHHGAPQR